MTINNDPNILFNAQANGQGNTVDIFWGGIPIGEITGPTPLIDISKTTNRDQRDLIESFVNTITLTGKIFRQPEDPQHLNIVRLGAAYKRLEDLFKTCSVSTFEVKCSGQRVYLASGVKFVSLNVDKTSDNWTQSADFTATLEFLEPASGEKYPVTDKVDSWSIEPLDDTSYMNYSKKVTQRQEWSNPKMKPNAATEASKQPAGNVGSTDGIGQGVETDLRIINVPQFRITRRLSAKGMIMPTGTGAICSTGTTNTSPPPISQISPPHLVAKAWVEQQQKLGFSSVSGSGGLLGFHGASGDYLIGDKKIWLYNHARTCNIDIYNGSYEAIDTWLAMPTGTPYTESFTLDVSTSIEYIKTVRVVGNIQGLSTPDLAYMVGDTGVLPTGTGSPMSGVDLSLAYATRTGNTLPITNRYVTDVLPDALSDVKDISSSGAYFNALEGWTKDIKPYLYRRACLALNGTDRTLFYVDPYAAAPGPNTPPAVPNNPIYCKETILSVIPVSTSEGHDPKNGTISYTYEYNNKFNVISGTITENISITTDAPTETVSEVSVPGRLQGPILQKTGYTTARKSISIELTVMPPTGIKGFFQTERTCPLWTGGFLYNTLNKFIEGVKPFGDIRGQDYTAIFGDYANNKNRQGVVYLASDQDSWTPTQGRYTRNVSWIYQQCDSSKSHLDH